MPARALTRRSLLLSSAGAGAVVLLRHPAATFAALASPPPARIDERAVGNLRAGISRIDLARNADLVALEWHAPRDARVELSFRGARGRWSAWAPAGAAAHGPDAAVGAAHARVSVRGAPVWSGGALAV